MPAVLEWMIFHLHHLMFSIAFLWSDPVGERLAAHRPSGLSLRVTSSSLTRVDIGPES